MTAIKSLLYKVAYQWYLIYNTSMYMRLMIKSAKSRHSIYWESVLNKVLKGGGHAKIIADFVGHIFSLGSVKTENIIFKIFRIH